MSSPSNPDDTSFLRMYAEHLRRVELRLRRESLNSQYAAFEVAADRAGRQRERLERLRDEARQHTDDA